MWCLIKSSLLIILGSITFACNVETNNLRVNETLAPKEIAKKTNKTNPNFEFAYDVGTRFNYTVIKANVDIAKKIQDIFPVERNGKIISHQNTLVASYAEAREDWLLAKSDDEFFNADQINIMSDLNYGESFSITGNVKFLNKLGLMEVDTMIRYMTVLPKSPVSYIKGKSNLIDYLKKESEEIITNAKNGEIDPGRISFVVTKEGKVEEVEVANSSGYKSIDKRMVQIIREIPGKWHIGKNAAGVKVNQKLIFSYGSMGC